MKVAIIGAGVAGLCSVKYLSEAFPAAAIDVLEATDNIGGLWVYNPQTDKDEYGIPVMANIYESLRTNLPKITMELTDFPIPQDYNDFMTQTQFLSYLEEYAARFNLHKYIKFRSYVTKVKRRDDRWVVEYTCLKEERTIVDSYDYVYVCSGRFHQPHYPQIQGSDIYKGRQLHSHVYRRPDVFKDRSVLIVGCGPSALDLSMDISKYTNKISLSHHQPRIIPRLTHVTHKPDMMKLTEDCVVFQDGSKQQFDDIIYCTGYEFHFPYLDESCGLDIQKHHIKHLYKHIVNVKYPTMFFIGIPKHVCAVVMRDRQAKYCTSLIKGYFQLPNEDEMLRMVQEREKQILEAGKGEKFIHDLILEEDDYYEEISKESGIERAPRIYVKIRTHLVRSDFRTFRNNKYTMVDNDNFKVTVNEST